MPVNVKEKIRKLSAPRRKKVEARAAELMAEEMTLKELRKARKITQERIAESLGIGQEGVSRLEKRSDPSAFYAAQDGRSDGRQSLAGGGIPGPFPGRSRRHCR